MKKTMLTAVSATVLAAGAASSLAQDAGGTPFGMPLPLIDLILLLLLAGNVLAFLLFWIDKAAARGGGWRISEDALLLAVVFGGLGAWMGQHILRHKTRKEPFRTRLGVLLALYVFTLLGAAALYIWLLQAG